MWDDPSPIQQEIAIKIARLFLTKDSFSPGDNDFGRVASRYGTKMIEWFIYQVPFSVAEKPRYDVSVALHGMLVQHLMVASVVLIELPS
jgi:hypothetical protein